MNKLKTTYDVAILGGGLAGLSLARQLLLEKADLKIIVIEARKHPVPEAGHKVGESLVEIGAHYFKERLGLGEHLDTEQLKKAGLRFFFPAKDNHDISQRVEFGATYFPDAPSFQLDRGRFENYLRELICQQGAEFFDAARVGSVELKDKFHQFSFSQQQQEYTVRSRWMIDASGRAGLLKRALELAEKVDHDANAAWFRVNAEIDIDTWSSEPAWQAAVPRGFRHLSTNHLMGEGYWVWLIPLASKHTSIGVVVDNDLHDFTKINSLEKTMQWLEQHEPQLAGVLQAGKYEVVDFHMLKNYSYSSQQVFSGDRWALTGEAGVFPDPFYSPGSDFIALSNEFIGKLILAELRGEHIALNSAIYNKQYLELFNSFLMIYQGQYKLMGNAGVMIRKISWDYAVYWGSIALLYFKQKITDINFMLSLNEDMNILMAVNQKMQAFFRQCAQQSIDFEHDHFTDTMSVDCLRDWNTQLLEPLSDDQLKERFRNNLYYLQKMAHRLQSECFNGVGVNDE